jgi:hypothetical protein
MAHLVVDGCADGFWIGFIARRGVIQRCRYAGLYIHHVIVAELIQFARGDAGLNLRPYEFKDFRRQPAGYAHFLDVIGTFDRG